MLKGQALQVLETKIAACKLCHELAEYREQTGGLTVPGEGNPNAQIMILGESPGQSESEQGKPFVGKSGRLLMNILQAMGLQREEVFICNILRCRPPGNRDPKVEEAANCRKFLDLQIRCIE